MTVAYTPAYLEKEDPAYWAVLRQIRLQAGVFGFKDHEYQLGWMQSTARRKCCMKGAQAGFTETEVISTLHGLIYGRYPRGVMYLFPTTDHVQEFSKSRFKSLIEQNQESIGQYVRTQKGSTDTASLKQVGNAFLYLRGARMTQTIDPTSGEKDTAALRSAPVDKVVLDELDLMGANETGIVEKAESRMGASTVKEMVALSTPTIPDDGIAAMFEDSDQRHWFRRCGYCDKTPPAEAPWEWFGDKKNGWTCAEESFPGCVRESKDRRGYIACVTCGRPVGIWPGQWVVKVPTNTAYMEGYRWSQLTSTFNDPLDILRAFENPPDGDPTNIYRLRLGLPYVSAEDKLAASTVLACCGGDLMQTGSRGPCAMGVDMGKTKHVVIGCRIDRERYEILRVAQVENLEEIHDLAQRFNVRSAVIDIRPYEDEARAFQKAERPMRIYLCEYLDTGVAEPDFETETGVVKVHKTEIFDRTHRLIVNKHIILPRECPEVSEFARQVSSAAKRLEVNKRSGTGIYRYRPVGRNGDHYRNALGYFVLAAGRVAILRPRGSEARPSKAVSEYPII
jgi:hypothetical protein